MKLAIITAHAGAECAEECISSWTDTKKFPPSPREDLDFVVLPSSPPLILVRGQDGMLPAYQLGFQVSRLPDVDCDILAFIHDDVIIRESGWQERVLKEFADPEVGLVGFGGALGHGTAGLYKEPYDHRQLARDHYMSNVDDAEVHGERFSGSRDVAVLEGYALIFRREVLEKSGGWPVGKIEYVGYDYWSSCITRRLGYRIRVCGIRCHHLGGRTYIDKGFGRRQGHWERYLDAHRYIYQEFADVLPFRTERI